MRLLFPSRRRVRRHSRGQSLVEFTLILPVLLVLMLITIDFGRVSLGWVNLQQMTRIAANDAANHASAWGTPGDAAERTRYQKKVLNDAQQINCSLPDVQSDGTPDIPPPQISGTTLGSHVRVAIDCEFSILTPIISNIVGGTILVSAETIYPVKEGIVATVPGGGSPIVAPPEADFVGSPQTGWAPLDVTFIDLSKGGPAAWTWDFSVGATGSGTSSPSTSLTQGSHTVTYDCPGVPGDRCMFGVSLKVSNKGGSDSLSRPGYITVEVPPDTGPIAEFAGTPRTGVKPLTVGFQFVDLRATAVTYTLFEWDLDGNGSFEATGQTTSHTYSAEGSYTVSLRVTDDSGGANPANTLTKVGYINVLRKICTVPDFANVKKNNAQSRWSAAGFSTQVLFGSGKGNYNISTQTIVGGTIDPQPNGCDSNITVGP